MAKYEVTVEDVVFHVYEVEAEDGTDAVEKVFSPEFEGDPINTEFDPLAGELMSVEEVE